MPEMAYEPYEWVDGQPGGTPITAGRLNALEQALADAHSLIGNLQQQVTDLSSQIDGKADSPVTTEHISGAGATGRSVLEAWGWGDARDAMGAAAAADLQALSERVSDLEGDN